MKTDLNNDSFEPPSKPEKVSVVDVTQDSVTLLFSAPSCGAEAVTSYRLEYRELREEDGQWQQQSEEKPGSVTVTGLRADTEYVFRVRAVTDVGLGPVAELKPDTESLRIPLEKDNGYPWLCTVIYGSDVPGKRNCTIMVMGATGAGKSTLINGMINYILGVQWTDPYRFKLVVERRNHSPESDV
ncbi:hypothetical protein WMY93_020563 [Mugilogobius chulae]|uniref:Fibronectin type-III domain-containing protein n=1 Tax=Mugilogobius chulae TaxID=88201 RepID=A0AAW0N879_9GOBI